MKCIIQIPCYNEEKTLPQTIRELPANIDGVDVVEFLIINDGSRDNTVKVARECGINHIVNFKNNKGLAKGFLAGIDACLKAGADIIVNTDADNQYLGADIARLVEPILAGRADIVIGERDIENTEHFSWRKKKLQRLGSFLVRISSNTEIPDAPSGFRAFSRDAAMRLNVINDYSYTLETIIQAGHNKMALAAVKIRTNQETRPSRLFKSMWRYICRSAMVIFRAFMMYKPLKFFSLAGALFALPGLLLGLRFLLLAFFGQGQGHVQSLILAAILILSGGFAVTIGLLADLIAANRKLLEDIQYRAKKIEMTYADEPSAE
jgi:glycosyltransferase involved in cell wall biosynthesis